jgi:hypothetical protein
VNVEDAVRLFHDNTLVGEYNSTTIRQPENENLANDCSTMYTTDEELFGAKTELYGMKVTECL